MVGQFMCGSQAGIRDRYNYIDIMLGPLSNNFGSQFSAHAQSSLVNGSAVNDGIRPSQVNIFEDAWREPGIFTAPAAL
jgi:hypothetical protein